MSNRTIDVLHTRLTLQLAQERATRVAANHVNGVSAGNDILWQLGQLVTEGVRADALIHVLRYGPNPDAMAKDLAKEDIRRNLRELRKALDKMDAELDGIVDESVETFLKAREELSAKA